MLVNSFNLSQLFNSTPYLFTKNGSKERSILSIYRPKDRAGHVSFVECVFKSGLPTASIEYIPFFALFPC